MYLLYFRYFWYFLFYRYVKPTRISTSFRETRTKTNVGHRKRNSRTRSVHEGRISNCAFGVILNCESNIEEGDTFDVSLKFPRVPIFHNGKPYTIVCLYGSLARASVPLYFYKWIEAKTTSASTILCHYVLNPNNLSTPSTRTLIFTLVYPYNFSQLFPLPIQSTQDNSNKSTPTKQQHFPKDIKPRKGGCGTSLADMYTLPQRIPPRVKRKKCALLATPACHKWSPMSLVSLGVSGTDTTKGCCNSCTPPPPDHPTCHMPLRGASCAPVGGRPSP